ncbi:hypothetical protein D3C86_1367060 [compost metagenome]
MMLLTAKAIIIACIPAFAAAIGSFSPMRRATTAVAAILIPIAKEYIIVSTDSVKPTV